MAIVGAGGAAIASVDMGQWQHAGCSRSELMDDPVARVYGPNRHPLHAERIVSPE